MMMKNRILISGAVAALMSCIGAFAQETDLSAQQSEIQTVNPVPGHKIDHKGLIINPTPHEMRVDWTGSLNIGEGFRIVDRKNAFPDGLSFAGKGRIRITVDFGSGKAARHGVKPVSGAYFLEAGPKEITIIGYDGTGAFYGIQTLKQILESPAARSGSLPYIVIRDYPDMRSRGIVEGFYGTPWSHQTRLSMIDFCGKYKLNTYIYGPKDDPYHSCPGWRQPYPEKEAENLVQLIEACRRNRVDFVWAIHPGQDIKWNEEDYALLVKKFGLMYDLGVRHFAVFFDDISGEGTDAAKQTGLLNRLTEDFVNTKGDVAPLMVCPTDYNKYWSDPSENGSLFTYGRTLFPQIAVFWTGDAICSDLTPSTLDFIGQRIRRPAYFWWNYPVTDYAMQYILQGPVYGLDTTLTADDVSGFVSNPMEHGEASKLALYSVADYTWNIGGYNPLDSWERALSAAMPEAAEAYRRFAIHSCDTETRYRRDESWETRTFTLDTWTDDAAEALERECMAIEQVPSILEEKCANRELLAELRPWLAELGKLGTRCRKAIELGRLCREGRMDDGFWKLYSENVMSEEERAAYEAHKCGTLKLQPFYERMMSDIQKVAR